MRQDAPQLFAAVQEAGLLGDFRHPDVIRLAPVPLYNTFTEVWRAGEILGSAVKR